MAITAHFCAKDENNRLVVHHCLLAFRVVQGEHSGKLLAKEFIDILRDARILHKVSILLNYND